MERNPYAKMLISEYWSKGRLPTMIDYTLSQVDRFAGVKLIERFLDVPIRLNGEKTSVVDVLAILGVRSEQIVMVVDCIVDRFDEKPFEERLAASPLPSQSLDPDDKGAGVSSRLFLQTTSAASEARRRGARTAVMMVHSFDPSDGGMGDFQAFAAALGFHGAAATKIAGPLTIQGVELYIGWTADRPSDEGFSIVNGRKSDGGFFDDDD